MSFNSATSPETLFLSWEIDLRISWRISSEMKRLRDDGSSSQSGFLSGDLCSGGGGDSDLGRTGQEQTENDALTYLKEVKETLQDQREKYDMFLKIMKDFRAQRSDVSGAIAKVKELFKGHNKLISGFNIFLPKGSELALEHDEAAPQTKKIDFEEALNVVTKIKKRFQNDEHVYIAFLKILNEFRKGHKDINKVYYEISILLKGHADLINEFTRFLFPKAEPVSAKNKHYHQNDRHYKAFVDILKMYRKEHKDKTKVYNEVATLLFRSSGFA